MGASADPHRSTTRAPSPPRAASPVHNHYQQARALSAVAAPAAAPSAAAAGAASSAHESLFQVIAAAGLQVRDGAAHSCKQVGFLPSQSLVRISARNGEWARLLHPRFGGHHSVWICEAEGGEPTTRLLDLRKAGR